jgi:hypothetical protein
MSTLSLQNDESVRQQVVLLLLPETELCIPAPCHTFAHGVTDDFTVKDISYASQIDRATLLRLVCR